MKTNPPIRPEDARTCIGQQVEIETCGGRHHEGFVWNVIDDQIRLSAGIGEHPAKMPLPDSLPLLDIRVDLTDIAKLTILSTSNAWLCSGGLISCAACCPYPKNTEKFSSLDAVVQSYIAKDRPRATCELRFYARQETLEKAIEKAASCKRCDGEIHSHQEKIPAWALKSAEEKLLAAKGRLQSLETFDRLHTFIGDTIRIKGVIGALTIYDISHRIGAYLQLQPEQVYLHKGALKGAQFLGFHATKEGDKLAKEELVRRDPAFHKLEPYEIEDCLCIYQHHLSGK